MKTRLQIHSVSRWRKARRKKAKEMSARFVVAQIECTMRQGKKTRFRFLHFQRMKSFVEFRKTVWRESRGKTVSVQLRQLWFATSIFEQMTHYEGISMTKFNNLKVKRVKSNLKYTESKLVKQRPR